MIFVIIILLLCVFCKKTFHMDSTTGPGRLVIKVSAPRDGGSWLDPDGGTGRLDPFHPLENHM